MAGFSGSDIRVEVISGDVKSLAADLGEEHSARLYSRGGHFTPSEMLPVYFMLVIGCNDDDDSYTNFLFTLKEELKKQNRPFAFIDEPLDEPSDRVRNAFSSIDMSSIQSVISGLCMHIDIKNGRERTVLAKRALGDMLSNSGAAVSDIFEVGLSAVLKLNIVANGTGVSDDGRIPIILYYGIPTPADVMFLCYAMRCGFDVLCISPDKDAKRAFAMCPYADKLQTEELPRSRPVTPFPQKPVKTKIATVAYNAERELDTMLYADDSIFRDMQFKKMDSAVLKTTVDELFILWDQPARFRSGFTVNGDRVIIPNIFAKLSGVKDGNIKEYWNMVENMLTPDTVYIIKAVTNPRPLDMRITRSLSAYRDGSVIKTEQLKRSQLNPYAFLPDHLQNLIFEKMQSVINDGLLKMDTAAESIDYAMYAALTIDRSVLRLLQNFDFTKDVPKIVVEDAVEALFTKLECTQLLLYSYLGFDVAVLSPCGYRDIEAYVSENAFESYTFNEFVYNVKVPKFKIPNEPLRKKKKGGLFGGLFK